MNRDSLIVSDLKLGIFFKIKEGENYNHPGVMCFAFHRAGRNALAYVEGYNLRLTQRLGKIAVFGRALDTFGRLEGRGE